MVELRMVRPGGRLSVVFQGRSLSIWLGLLILITLPKLAGCARSLRNIDAARDAYAVGDLARASETLGDLSEGRSRFADAASLDLAIVELASGDAPAAEKRLRALRDRFDSLPKIAPMHEAAAVATDDTARLFRPAGYEEVMIRAMLAICSLAHDQFDAESYTLQAMSKQAELARRAEDRGISLESKAFQPIALAPYLRGVLREATHRDYDDAARAYQLVSAVQPQFAPAQEDIRRASVGTHSAPGHGVLYVLACVGRGPVLQEACLPTTTMSLQIASVVLNAATNEQEGEERNVPTLPNIASVDVPQVVVPPSEVAALGVRVGGELYGATQTLTHVGDLARAQVEAEMPWTIARAVVRRAAKETTVATLGDAIGLEGDAGSLFHFAASSAWSGLERADTRCWGLLPREIQVLRAELPAATHHVHLEPLGGAGQALAPGLSHRVEIVDGKNHYLVAIAPGRVVYLVP